MDTLRLEDISQAPWCLHEGGTSVVDNEGRLVASCGFIPRKSVFEERANAKLISIAPDLVNALRDIVNEIEDKSNGDYSGSIRIEVAVSILRQIDAYDDLCA